MRALLLGLALLAGLKIWVQDSVYRSATEGALIKAYHERAAAACLGAAPKGIRDLPVGLAIDWLRGTAARIVVGNSALGVYLWEVDSELWNARFKRPYLILSAPEASLSCAYDITSDTAEVSRL